jgi:hypothetical protein
MQGDTTQQEMDFRGPVGGGYAAWQWDHDQAVKNISELWGLPLNRRVRLKLINIDSEFVGKLTLAEFPLSLDRRRPLLLRLPPLQFSSTEIEWCAVVD